MEDMTGKFDMMLDEVERIWNFLQGFVDCSSKDFITEVKR
jgi:hypothetical protein